MGNMEKPDKFINTVLDEKYKIESLIGKGTTGNVYKGYHLYLNMPIAIKILHQSLLSNKTAQKRFRQEARLATAIQHSNAMSVMDFGILNNEIYYLIMEYIEGISLSHLIRKEKTISIPRAIKIAQQIALAVNAAHQKNIIHRDLKPANIMIIQCGTPQEMVKVIDFSIAKQVEDESNLTAKDTVLGTPKYISPEQIQHEGINNRSDIYSLGIILYEMLTGEPPFLAKTVGALFMQHIHAQPTPPRQKNPQIPLALEKLILQMLEKESDQRPSSMSILATQLVAALSSAEIIETSPAPNILSAAPPPEEAGSETIESTRSTYLNRPSNLTSMDNSFKGAATSKLTPLNTTSHAKPTNAQINMAIAAQATINKNLPPPANIRPHQKEKLAKIKRTKKRPNFWQRLWAVFFPPDD